jgi:predicted DsbA family dithiol-disulfide isomerase
MEGFPAPSEEGVSLEQLFAGRAVDREEMRRRLGKAAEDFGVPFRGSERIYNSRLAQELGLWSESKNKGDEFHSAVFKAYFVEGQNISAVPVLVEVASSVGLPAGEAAEIVASRAFKEAVDAEWALSRAKSITAVPTLVLNQDEVVGAQPYSVLEKLMETNGVKRRSIHSS